MIWNRGHSHALFGAFRTNPWPHAAGLPFSKHCDGLTELILGLTVALRVLDWSQHMALLGTMPEIVRAVPDSAPLAALAAGFSLWSSVSEGQSTRLLSGRDLFLLNIAAGAGATTMVSLGSLLTGAACPNAEFLMVIGAFLVGYLKRFGILGAGIGSQFFIGQLLAFGAALSAAHLSVIAAASMIGAVTSIIPRILSGPAEHPVVSVSADVTQEGSSAIAMGLQAGFSALTIALLNLWFHPYDVACGAYAFTLLVTLALMGEHSIALLVARAWETLLGGALGLAAATFILPLRREEKILE
jgi:hypothetical protein